MLTITEEQTPAKIVKIFPKASDLFKENRINFCCGGDKPLKETFDEGNYNAEEILSELNTLYQAWQEENEMATDWDSLTSSQLIDHIVDTHHAYLKNELNPIGEFVTKIYNVHGGENHPHLEALYHTYHEFKKEMETQMIAGEYDIFPLIKEYEANPNEALRAQIITASNELKNKHVVATDLLKRMRELTNDFNPPADACGSYRISYARLDELEENTLQHIHLENNILFNQI